MKKRLLSLLFAFTTLFIVTYTVAEDGTTVMTYQVNPKAMASSDFATRLLMMLEWEPFFETFTDTCDKALTKELLSEKVQKHLPGDVADDVRKLIDSGVSTRKGIEALFNHLESIIFELQAEDFDTDYLQNLGNFIQGRKKDLDNDFNGLLAFVIDKNPRAGLAVLKYMKEKRDYQFLRNEPDGDFILQFDFKIHDRNIDFCCAGVKIDENRFAVLFSNYDSITRYYDSFKTGKYSKLDTSQPKVEFVLEEPCFLALDPQRKKANVNSNGAEFFAKMKQVKITIHDVGGISQVEATAAMRTADDAKLLQDLLTGIIGFAQLNQDEKSPEQRILKSLQANTAGNDVSLVVKLDNPDLWKLIRKGLKKATEEMKDR